MVFSACSRCAFIELCHNPANGRRRLQEVNIVAGFSEIQGCLNSGNPSSYDQNRPNCVCHPTPHWPILLDQSLRPQYPDGICNVATQPLLDVLMAKSQPYQFREIENGEVELSPGIPL